MKQPRSELPTRLEAGAASNASSRSTAAFGASPSASRFNASIWSAIHSCGSPKTRGAFSPANTFSRKTSQMIASRYVCAIGNAEGSSSAQSFSCVMARFQSP